MESVQRLSNHRDSGARRRWLSLPLGVRRSCVLALLLMPLCLWCWYFFADAGTFHGRLGERGAYAADYTMYMSAAAAVEQGKNPYDHATLLRVEDSFLRARRLTPELIRPDTIRVGYPPLVFWAMQPLTHLPFQPLGIAWMVTLYLLAGLGVVCLLRFVGWRYRLLPALLFLLLPQVIKGAAYGNLTALVFAGVGISLIVSRRYPVPAGALLTVLWLKPQVGCAIFLLVMLFSVRDRRGVLAGFVAGSAAWLLLTVAAVGVPSLSLWIHGLTGYYRDVTEQPYLPSLTALYDSWAPIPLRLTLTGAAILLALAATALVARNGRARVSPVAVAGLWFLWFVVTPYVHLYDEVFLALPVLQCLGHDGRRIVRPLPALGAAMLAFASLPITWMPWVAAGTLLTLALLELGLSPRLRSSMVLLAALCCVWAAYPYLPGHTRAESLIVTASGLALISTAVRKMPWRPAPSSVAHRPG